MKPYQNLVGLRFGKLVVKSRGYHQKSGTIEWACVCDCGNTKVIPSGSLRAGKVKSCGCLRKSKPPLTELIGRVCGRLTVVSFHSRASNRVSKWTCRCSCGNTVVVRRSNLWLGRGNPEEKTFSCGCQKSEHVRAAQTTHGQRPRGPQSKEYACWQNMLQRCENKSNPTYKSYGAKGVTVCEQWHEYAQFLADVGRAPFSDAHIDRIDPYGNYEPDNVRWVDVETSNANKRA